MPREPIEKPWIRIHRSLNEGFQGNSSALAFSYNYLLGETYPHQIRIQNLPFLSQVSLAEGNMLTFHSSGSTSRKREGEHVIVAFEDGQDARILLKALGRFSHLKDQAKHAFDSIKFHRRPR